METVFETRILMILQQHILRIHEALMKEEDLSSAKTLAMYRLLLALMRQHRAVTKDLNSPAESFEKVMQLLPGISAAAPQTSNGKHKPDKPAPAGNGNPPEEIDALIKEAEAELVNIQRERKALEKQLAKKKPDYDEYEDR